MGMTWSLVVILGLVSSSWLSPKAPVFGILIAKKEYAELDRQFWKTTRIVLSVSVIVAFLIWLMVFSINNVNNVVVRKFAQRLLPPLPTGLFLAAQLLYIISSPFSTYLRAHKKEPLMIFFNSLCLYCWFVYSPDGQILFSDRHGNRIFYSECLLYAGRNFYLEQVP